MSGIQLEFEFPAPPERVWHLLTDRDQLTAWFMETDFVPEVGRRFMIWPGPGLPAIDGPISAVVLEIAAPHTLLMGWQSPNTQTEMTWTLQATTQGTRLRVVETGHVGTAEVARERALAQLFDNDLRDPLEHSATAPRAGVAEAPAAGGSGYSPGAAPVPAAPPALGIAPVGRTAPEPYLRGPVWLVVVLGAVVLALIVAGIVWPPVQADGDAHSSGGVNSLGSSPVGGMSSSPTGSMGSASVDGTIPGPGFRPQSGPARLTASSAYTSTLTEHTVTVTVTNAGGTAGHWTSAAVVLGAADLIVTPIGSEVSQTSHGSTHCFYPTAPAASVPAGGSYQFRFTITLGVTAMLSGDPVQSVTLDGGVC